MTTIPLVQVRAEDAPIACALNPGELEARMASLQALAARALIARTTIEGGQRLTFLDGPAVERQLRDAVAAESSCCSFLSMRLERTDRAIVLDITGPAEAQPVIAELFA